MVDLIKMRGEKVLVAGGKLVRNCFCCQDPSVATEDHTICCSVYPDPPWSDTNIVCSTDNVFGVAGTEIVDFPASTPSYFSRFGCEINVFANFTVKTQFLSGNTSGAATTYLIRQDNFFLYVDPGGPSLRLQMFDVCQNPPFQDGRNLLQFPRPGQDEIPVNQWVDVIFDWDAATRTAHLKWTAEDGSEDEADLVLTRPVQGCCSPDTYIGSRSLIQQDVQITCVRITP